MVNVVVAGNLINSCLVLLPGLSVEFIIQGALLSKQVCRALT